jgi:hypothetical protein
VKNPYPWYDSQWLCSYVQAKEIIKQHRPALLQEFIQTLSVFETQSDFQVEKLNNPLKEQTLEEISRLIKESKKNDLEKQELFRFGRLIVHDHPYCNELQKSLTDLVSEIAQEAVEPYYNFLSLYNNLGVCEVHMDAPYAKWTLDICIEQSAPWPIYFSQTRPWPEDFSASGQDWQAQIKGNPENIFTKFTLNSGEGIVFSGSSQWHYRERIQQQSRNNYCHLIFFHYIPEGSSQFIKPSSWGDFFAVPELGRLKDG